MSYRPGYHKVLIVSHMLTKSAQKGTPELRFGVQPVEREDGSDLGDDKPRTASVYITDGTAERVFEILVNLGYPYATFDQLAADHPQAHSFQGAEGRLEMKIENYQNKDREKWEFVGGKATAPLAKSEASALNRFSAAFKQKRAEMGSPAKQPQAVGAGASAPNNSTFSDSDVI